MYEYTVFLQKYPVEQIRPWPLNLRTNQTNRPTLLDLETELHKPLIEVCLISFCISIPLLFYVSKSLPRTFFLSLSVV